MTIFRQAQSSTKTRCTSFSENLGFYTNTPILHQSVLKSVQQQKNRIIFSFTLPLRSYSFSGASVFSHKKIRPFIIPIVVTLVVLVLFHSIFMLGYVPTESMEPTLETGSLILGLRIFDELETGDIIIFRRDGSYLVKRIAACAGDTIDHQNSIVTVPDNCYYVLGDNAENSHDSRYWADPYVSHEDVIAKLLMPIK